MRCPPAPAPEPSQEEDIILSNDLCSPSPFRRDPERNHRSDLLEELPDQDKQQKRALSVWRKALLGLWRAPTQALRWLGWGSPAAPPLPGPDPAIPGFHSRPHLHDNRILLMLQPPRN
ncbi:hypothetical protein TREES_T100019634 [Tupaia chinensis]|uniref:Uncharacterized protein n=1 Tax=Tupaia chinensis TaxID=246437 RepID=L9JU60_TUPCH|nr:hypothetical protein TREES_T100019634 [Tupaia chinensis]